MNDCADEVDGDGSVTACPSSTVDKDAIVGFVALRLTAVLPGDDSAAIGDGVTAGACGFRAADVNAVCLVTEFADGPTQPDGVVSGRIDGSFTGEDLFSEDGSGQTIRAKVERGTARDLFFRLESTSSSLIDAAAVRVVVS